MTKDNGPAGCCFSVILVLPLLTGVSPLMAEDSVTCDGKVANDNDYKTVDVISIISENVRVIDPETKSSTGERVAAASLKNSGRTIRDAFGLVCLPRKDGSGAVWTYASSVEYKCIVKSTDLAASAGRGGTMGLGEGGCEE